MEYRGLSLTPNLLWEAIFFAGETLKLYVCVCMHGGGITAKLAPLIDRYRRLQPIKRFQWQK